MAIEIQKIQLKRADGTTAVSSASLDRGEPAIAFTNRELWVGDGTGNVKISDLVVVANNASLPGTGNSTKLYLVLTDETLGNESALYSFKGGDYELVTGGTAGLTSADISDFVTAVNDQINVRRGAVDGIAPLDSGSKIPSTYLPDLSITDVHVVADNAARDALTVQAGDVAVVTGTNTTYIYTGSAWQEMLTAPDGVTSVNGSSGPVVVLDTDDIAEGSGNLYFTTARAIAAIIDDAAADNTTNKAWSINKTNLEIADAKTYLGSKQIDEANIGDGKSVVYNSTSGNLEYHAITINGGEL